MRTKNRTRVCGLLGRSQDETAADVEGMVAALQEQIALLVTVRSPRNDFQRVPILTPKPYNWVLPWIFLFCRSLWLPWRWPSHL